MHTLFLWFIIISTYIYTVTYDERNSIGYYSRYNVKVQGFWCDDDLWVANDPNVQL